MPDINIVHLPQVINFTRLKGDTFIYTFVFTNSLGQAIDLTAYTKITMQIKKKPGAVDYLWQADLIAGMTIGGVGNNELYVKKILDIAGGDYYHDLQLEKPVDDIWTPVGGSFKVVTDVTVTV